VGENLTHHQRNEHGDRQRETRGIARPQTFVDDERGDAAAGGDQDRELELDRP
jgi:hypothetical protein